MRTQENGRSKRRRISRALRSSPRSASFERLEERTLLNGSYDLSFGGLPGPGVFVFNEGASGISAVALQPDGKIVLAGSVLRDGSNRDFAALRLNADGTVDQGFGTRGRVVVGFDLGGGNEDSAHDVAIDAEGNILIAGEAEQGGFVGADRDLDFAVVRLTPDGSLDPSFDGDGKRTIAFDFDFDAGVTLDRARGVAIDDQGRIVLAGAAERTDLNLDFAVARLLPDGALDLSFGTIGKQTVPFDLGPSGSDDVGEDVAIDSQGRIVVAGSAQRAPGSIDDFAAARLNPDGSLDSTFDGDGKQTVAFDLGNDDDEANAVAIDDQGRIVLAGSARNSDGTADFGVARLTTDGQPDPSFSTDGKRTIAFDLSPAVAGGEDSASDVAIDSRGRIVLAGSASGGGYAVARLTTGGALDPSFDGDGKQTVPFDPELPVSAFAGALALRPDDRIVVGGNVRLLSMTTTSQTDFGVAALDAEGGVDPSFSGMQGRATLDAPGLQRESNAFSRAELAIQPDGKLVSVAAVRRNDLADDDFIIVRVNADGSPDTGFGAGGQVIVPFDLGGMNHDVASGVVIQPDGKIVVSGSVSVGADDRDFALIRLLADGTLDPSFGTDGTLTFGFNFGGGTDEALISMALAPDGGILVAGTIGQDPNNGDANSDLGVARVLPSGELDGAFGVDGRARVAFDLGGPLADGLTDMVIQPDGKILLAGNAVEDSGLTNSATIARLTASGLPDEFGTDGKVTVRFDEPITLATSMALQPDGKIVLAGMVGDIDDLTSFRLALFRLNPDGSRDTIGEANRLVFNDVIVPIIFTPDTDLVIDEAGVISLMVLDLVQRAVTVARMDPDGVLDLSFSEDGLQEIRFEGLVAPTPTPGDLAQRPDGRLVISTTIDQENADGSFASSFGFAQIHTDATPPQLLRIEPVEPNPRNTPIESVVVVFNEPINPATLSASNVAITRDGQTIALDTSSLTFTLADGTDASYIISGFGDATAPEGAYRLTVNPTGVLDPAGNAGTGSPSAVEFEVDLSPPGLVRIDPVDPSPRNTPLDSVVVVFNEPIDTSSLSSSDFTLTRYGQAVPLDTTSLSLSRIEGTNSYTVSGLAPATTTPGAYRLTLSPAGILDPAGNAATGDSPSVEFVIIPSGVPRIVRGDYDGDRRTDLALYRFDPASGEGVFEIQLATGDRQTIRISGLNGNDIPVSGDFDGDGITDAAAYQPTADLNGDGIADAGRWVIRRSASPEGQQIIRIPFGAPGELDRPSPADFDGDGITDIATFRADSDLTPGAAEWFILPSRPNPGFETINGAFAVAFGASGGTDLPAAFDFDGDGRADIGTFRPVSDLVPGAAQWFVLPSSRNDATFTQALGGFAVVFGAAGNADQPAVADFDGDDREDIAAFRSVSDLVPGQAQWFVLPSQPNQPFYQSNEGGFPVTFGNADEIAAIGDYGGDGRPDYAVFAGDGTWRISVTGADAQPSERVESITFDPFGGLGVPVLSPLFFRLLATGNASRT